MALVITNIVEKNNMCDSAHFREIAWTVAPRGDWQYSTRKAAIACHRIAYNFFGYNLIIKRFNNAYLL